MRGIPLPIVNSDHMETFCTFFLSQTWIMIGLYIQNGAKRSYFKRLEFKFFK